MINDDNEDHDDVDDDGAGSHCSKAGYTAPLTGLWGFCRCTTGVHIHISAPAEYTRFTRLTSVHQIDITSLHQQCSGTQCSTPESSFHLHLTHTFTRNHSFHQNRTPSPCFHLPDWHLTWTFFTRPIYLYTRRVHQSHILISLTYYFHTLFTHRPRFHTHPFTLFPSAPEYTSQVLIHQIHIYKIYQI